ncbi:MAG TPA: nitrous oxide reductase accessory protein NosL [Candidatus Sulfomarinibacteraceae bacterium]|nr:nitrous oxide reductase accessory protein NosL [Candidatus Sulfomarinibacteraceae bacterium]
MNNYRLITLVLLFAIFLAACGGADDAAGPPEIRYGEDVCDQCNMIINEPRFAAAYVTEPGETRRFDDLGEMFLYAHDQDEAVRAFWVHDLHSEEWLEADNASYVYNPELVTPMGWGVAAFDSQSDAEAYQEENGGTLLSYTKLQEQIVRGELQPQRMGAVDDHDHE